MLRSRFFFCVFCPLLAAVLLLLAALFAPPAAQAQGKAGPVSFINDVAPILQKNCFACHDSKKRKGKLDLTTYEAFRKGGDKDDPIAPGKPDDSYLMHALTATDKSRMPPKESGEPLSKMQIALIERWIKEGAKLDAGLTPKTDLGRELRARWQPPVPPAKYPFPVAITALAFTPDGKALVIGGQHELSLWDVTEGKLQKRIRTRAERARGAVFLPDGKLAVAGGRPGQEGDVRIYDITGGKSKIVEGVEVLDGVNDPGVMVKKLLEADDEVWCVAISFDGKKLASGGSDRVVNVWDLSGGYANAKLEQSIENHADWVLGLSFSTDGKHLVTGSRDKTAKVWDLSARESVLTFPGHQNDVFSVAIKADGKVGYSAGRDNQIRSWNATGDAKQIRAMTGHNDVIVRMLYHPKQALLATASHDKTVRLWNPDTGAAVRTLSGHNDCVFALAISPDGNLIASGTFNGEVKVWNVADGKLIREFNGSPGFLPPKPAETPKKG